MNCKTLYAAQAFSHIYVEKELVNNKKAQEIISSFPGAVVITIDHYKDVFNRKKQDVKKQHLSQNLILASKKGQLLYKGAPVCQSFGREHFYYTSCMMNCIYDCEYCYLKGMYPSGNLVIFLNLDDIFSETEKLLQEFPVYLCVSYDTDMMALENLTGFVKRWVEFTKVHENLTIEIRTKCGRTDIWNQIDSCDRVIFAYTISPEEIIDKFEKKTSTLSQRLQAAKMGIENGFKVRLCFDPMIYTPDFKTVYKKMMDEVLSNIDITKVKDFSVGSFRISDSYLKIMRKQERTSAVCWYPFELTDGYYHYPDNLTKNMEEYLVNLIMDKDAGASIFRWQE
ncbi:SPL family radical SAM protein [Butyrivibrio sp. NC3005]|uniref:SPL family radical SAM protein n=1 Tax=Butyrivibrio sp. NC3005 TaxID=1280685 RepID=UPI000416B703|nr:deoxyribodipyrimidine photo-lyase [Butyrivibrio sp. NC3005]